MKSRTCKYAALLVAGGFVVQLAGCASVAAQIGLSLLFRSLVSGILGALVGAAAQAGGNA